MARQVTLDPSPDVQLFGDAVVIRGLAAVDAYRLLTEGIAQVQRRDGIGPSPRLLQTLGALKASAATRTSSASLDIPDVRKASPSASLRTGEVLGIEEVARLCGVGVRHASRLAPTLGGWRTATRGRPWNFDRGLVRAYLVERDQDTRRNP